MSDCVQISILTVARNAKDGLLETLDSVSRQSFSSREHIVIDGASKDGSVALLQERRDHRLKWLSEPDAGISDAFNKAVLRSSGKIIIFLGAGDKFKNKDVLSNVAELIGNSNHPVFVYGDIEYQYNNSARVIRRNFSFKRFCRYNCIPHQAMFLDRWFFDQYGLFDLKYKRAMDYEHIARFIRFYKPRHIPLIIAQMPRDGVSTDPIPAHNEMDEVRRIHRLASEPGIWRTRMVLRLKMILQEGLYGHPW